MFRAILFLYCSPGEFLSNIWGCFGTRQREVHNNIKILIFLESKMSPFGLSSTILAFLGMNTLYQIPTSLTTYNFMDIPLYRLSKPKSGIFFRSLRVSFSLGQSRGKEIQEYPVWLVSAWICFTHSL
jgi:hypothetical protein